MNFTRRFPAAGKARLLRLRFAPLLAWLICPVLAAPVLAQMPPPLKEEKSDAPLLAEEMRGLWVVRDSLTSPQAVHDVIVTAVKYRFNALFVQVRGRGDAYYNSPYEPRAEILAHQPRTFDPLAQMVTEAHANGLQVHAWLCTYLAWSGNHRPQSSQHLWNAHRDWFAADRSGHCSCAATSRSEGAFLQPSNPAVQQHLFNVFTGVAENYDVDGIHFDYCRYAGADYDFSAGTLARFRAYMQTQLTTEQSAHFEARLKTDRLAYVHAFGTEWADWRREQVTGLVRRISTAVKAKKPWMQVSAAVFADGKEAFSVRGQDWRGWLKAGYLDAVALMSYAKSTETMLEQTRQAVAAAGEKHVYTGIGAWRLQAHDVADKIAKVRQTGAAGVNLFSYNGVHTRPDYLNTLARGVFASRAAPPRMRWLPGRDKPQQVAGETQKAEKQ